MSRPQCREDSCTTPVTGKGKSSTGKRMYRTVCEWHRKRNSRPLTPEQVKKRYARKKLARTVKAGKLDRQACEACSLVFTEAHHPDYDKPTDVVWLCREHHLAIHELVNSI